jgi:rRNA maturation protein Rpf1
VPKSIYIIRGKKSLENIFELMISFNVDKLIIADSNKGNPLTLRCYEIENNDLKEKYIITLQGIKTNISNSKKIKQVRQIKVEIYDDFNPALLIFVTNFLKVENKGEAIIKVGKDVLAIKRTEGEIILKVKDIKIL